jgi:hypothetical protein
VTNKIRHFEEFVMPGQKRVFALDVPGIHVFAELELEKTWMAGTSPAMTKIGSRCAPHHEEEGLTPAASHRP